MEETMSTQEEQYITDEISSNIFVNYGTKMEGEVDVSNTPRRRYYGDLIKDTYTSEDYPETNFLGTNQQRLNNKTILFLEWQFDSVDDKYFKSKYEVRSGISLYLNRALQQETKGYVYKITEGWTEYLVTHNTKPNTELLGQFDVPVNETGWVDIDLGDYLADYKKENNIFNEKLAIVIDSEESTYTYSRESGEDDLVPELWYEYYFVPPNSAIRSYPSLVNVREDGIADYLTGIVDVESDYGRDKGSIIIDIDKILDKDSFNGLLTAMGSDKPNFLSNIKIEKIYEEDKYTAITFVGHDGKDKFNSVINIEELDRLEDIKGTIRVYHEKEPEFNGIIDIEQLDRTENINGDITVYYDEEPEFNAVIKIDDITVQRLFNSIVTVYKDNKLEFNSIINIDKQNKDSEFNSNIQVYDIKDSEFNSILNIEKLVEKPEFNAKTFILELNKGIFNGNINIPSFDGSNRFATEIEVMGSKENNLTGLINIEELEDKDSISGKINVEQLDTSSMNGIIRIKPEESKAYSFIM